MRGRSVSAELRIGLKSFDAFAVPLPGGREEIVVVLHDVTQLKALEKVKADLVTNVSHELRTPLTAIKGYAETLEGELPGGIPPLPADYPAPHRAIDRPGE